MTIRCEIVTAEKTIFSEDVDYVSIPGIEGQFGVKQKHSAMLTVMRFGEVYVRTDGTEQYFAVGGGIVEVQPDKVIILADAAERADAIDVELVEKARAEAAQVMEEGVPDDPDKYAALQSQLRLAELQLSVRRKRFPNLQSNKPPQFSE